MESYLEEGDIYITCVFGEWAGKEGAGKVVQKGTYAKMARGEMVRFLAERQAKRPEEMKEFGRLGYQFREALSTDRNYIFLREEVI